MHSSDRMKTLFRMFKDYDKNIVFRGCQMHFLNIYFKRKETILTFFRHFVNCQKLLLSNRYWTTFVKLPVKGQPLLYYLCYLCNVVITLYTGDNVEYFSFRVTQSRYVHRVKCRSIKYKQPTRHFVFRCAYTHSATTSLPLLDYLCKTACQKSTVIGLLL